MAEAKASSKKKAQAVMQPDQFMNTNDWPLYRPKILYRVKQVEEGSDEFAMMSSEGDMQVLSQEELLASFEPVKGLHKGENFAEQLAAAQASEDE